MKEIEEKIAELKRRWPAHSVPLHMWEELEQLETELEEALAGGLEEPDGRQDSSRRLS
ncbi:MAG TPA: hypothetical protein VJP78_08470 [Thermoleophilia bacterium]|nr:hypothetical protein [Thermoleophilia bacterium]